MPPKPNRRVRQRLNVMRKGLQAPKPVLRYGQR
jgi:hypothetical protein